MLPLLLLNQSRSFLASSWKFLKVLVKRRDFPKPIFKVPVLKSEAKAESNFPSYNSCDNQHGAVEQRVVKKLLIFYPGSRGWWLPFPYELNRTNTEIDAIFLNFLNSIKYNKSRRIVKWAHDYLQFLKCSCCSPRASYIYLRKIHQNWSYTRWHDRVHMNKLQSGASSLFLFINKIYF